jgi:hypothetical protein
LSKYNGEDLPKKKFTAFGSLAKVLILHLLLFDLHKSDIDVRIIGGFNAEEGKGVRTH